MKITERIVIEESRHRDKHPGSEIRNNLQRRVEEIVREEEVELSEEEEY